MSETFGLTPDLFPPTGHFFACGPRALATITRRSGRDINEWIASRRAKDPENKRETDAGKIEMTWWAELLEFLEAHGFEFSACSTKQGELRLVKNRIGGQKYLQRRNMLPSLSRWVRESDKRQVYLVRVTGHFLVVRGGKVFDYNGDGLPTRKHKYARHKVTHFASVKGVG